MRSSPRALVPVIERFLFLQLAHRTRQGRRHQRPQLDQVPPLIQSPVDGGRRCNRRPHPATADLGFLLVAAPKKGESALAGYARSCRYRGGVEELYRVAMGDGDRFYDKHAKVVTYASPHRRGNGKPMPPVAPSREHVERVRRKVVRRFLVEELCWQLLEYIDAEDATIAGYHVQKDGPVPLSPVRPMRAAGAEPGDSPRHAPRTSRRA
jgi:hypothetical protein